MEQDLPTTIYVETYKIEEDDDISLELDDDEDDDSREDVSMFDSDNQEKIRVPRLQPVHVISTSDWTFRTSCAPNQPQSPPPMFHKPNTVWPEPCALNRSSAHTSIQGCNNVTPEPSVCTRETSTESDSHEQVLKEQVHYRLERLARSMRYTDVSRSMIEDIRNSLVPSSSRELSSAALAGYRSDMYEWINQQQRTSMNIG
ncbi:hypothetical protein ACA910_000721 [Epithemia clementina (nom. ined.)]